MPSLACRNSYNAYKSCLFWSIGEVDDVGYSYHAEILQSVGVLMPGFDYFEMA